ncbi:trypsin-like peptidase domain-containing protein [Streptosporangium sp. NPDC001559]|uniref:nSTAND1 domain-containing NTPase n=1 Tax=Streptosporangium sp. NPDC001559 TaxID=3366187 RepID=UPI0036EDBFEB
MAEAVRAWSSSPDEAMAMAVVQIRGRDGVGGGAGFLIAPDLVLTCAHVVSAALERPCEEAVAEGTPVTVEFSLRALPPGDDARPVWSARVENWVPIRAERTGDIAVLRLPEPVPGARPLPMADPDNVRGGRVRVVGFPRDAPGGTWFEGRLSGATGEGWVQLSRASGQVAHVRPGFSGSPVWDDALGAVVGLLVAAQPVGDAQQAYALRTRTIVREVPELGPVIDPPSPFRGLEPYGEGDADFFFGRQEDIGNIVKALRGARTVTVYGPSGCGKSSLALAGVAPRIREDGHEVLAFNAGEISSVRSALATELYEAARSGRYGPVRARSADQVETWLADKGLADTLHRTRGTASGGLLVVLDQAEALLNRPQAEVDELVDLLFPQRPTAGVRVLATLRSDLMDAVLKHPRLGPALLSGATVPLAPMSSGQLEEVIAKPVERLAAVEYEPGLARRILDDTGGEPGVLPLLGFVLQKLWEQRNGGYLRDAAYEEMQGVSGALGHHAERAWADQVDGKPEQEKAARRLLTKLVRMLPDSQILLRRRLTRDEVDETQWELVKAFAERRLLVLYGGEGEPESAELAHEALITAWPELRQQVEADGKLLTGQAELAHDLRRWQHGGRPANLLPDREQLQAIDQWLGGREGELTKEQREFLTLARRRSRMSQRRTHAVRTALTMVFALIVGLATFLVDQMLVSAERADENRSRALASFTAEMAKEDPGLATLAAAAAYEIAPTQEARNALLQRYDQLKDAVWMLTGVQGPIRAAGMSADGTVTLASSELGRATLFLRQAGGRILRKHFDLAGYATFPLVSRDGRRIAYVLEGTGTTIWHEVRHTAHGIVLGPAHRLYGTAPQRYVMGGISGSYKVIDFSPNADRIATVISDGRLQVWDLATQRLRRLPGRLPELRQVWFGPDENTLVAVRLGDGNSPVSIDLRSGSVRELENGRGMSEMDLTEAEVSADGRVLALCRKPSSAKKAVYQILRVSDGHRMTRYIPPAGYSSCQGLAVDRTGEHVAVNEGEGRWTLLSARPGTSPQRLEGPVLSLGDRAGPLLGTPDAPVVVRRDKISVIGWRMFADDGLQVFSPPLLLDQGRTMLIRVGKNGAGTADRLVIKETGGQERTLSEVRIPAMPPDPGLLLTVNRAGTLVADVTDQNRVTVYELPHLRRVAEFTARMPPAGKNGKRLRMTSFFFTDEELVTVSGSVIEHWNARNGRPLSDPFDIYGFLGGADLMELTVGPYYEPGYIKITNAHDHTLRAVRLATHMENPDLRISLGPDLITAAIEPSGRYAIVLTRGLMVELWSVQDRRRARKILGPFGPMEAEKWQVGIMENDGSESPGFFLANGSSVRLMRMTDSGDVEVTSYNFAGKQDFMEASDNGRVLLRNRKPTEYTAQGSVELFRLDPELWKSHLCGVLGRDLSEDERRNLPRGVPDVVCPA